MFSSSRFKCSTANTGDEKDEKEDEDDVFGSCFHSAMICGKPDAGGWNSSFNRRV